MQFIHDNRKRTSRVKDNTELCKMLEISFPTHKTKVHTYEEKGIQVYVYK